jgi:hypothetical protein
LSSLKLKKGQAPFSLRSQRPPCVAFALRIFGEKGLAK